MLLQADAALADRARLTATLMAGMGFGAVAACACALQFGRMRLLTGLLVAGALAAAVALLRGGSDAAASLDVGAFAGLMAAAAVLADNALRQPVADHLAPAPSRARRMFIPALAYMACAAAAALVSPATALAGAGGAAAGGAMRLAGARKGRRMTSAIVSVGLAGAGVVLALIVYAQRGASAPRPTGALPDVETWWLGAGALTEPTTGSGLVQLAVSLGGVGVLLAVLTLLGLMAGSLADRTRSRSRSGGRRRASPLVFGLLTAAVLLLLGPGLSAFPGGIAFAALVGAAASYGVPTHARNRRRGVEWDQDDAPQRAAAPSQP
jgi:hypothetical protein